MGFSATPIIETDRLCLVDFTDAHLDGLAAMNADPQVMEYFPATQSRAESAAFLQRLGAHQQKHGFSLFAVHSKDRGAFIGFTGLLTAEFEAPFTPAVEIGWRFVASAWGQGFASEAARACLTYGFQHCGLSEIVSFTALQNKRSIRVMEKIGMVHDAADDFDHPNLPADDPLCRHVLYRKRKSNETC